jgi:hypothetical protein
MYGPLNGLNACLVYLAKYCGKKTSVMNVIGINELHVLAYKLFLVTLRKTLIQCRFLLCAIEVLSRLIPPSHLVSHVHFKNADSRQASCVIEKQV